MRIIVSMFAFLICLPALAKPLAPPPLAAPASCYQAANLAERQLAIPAKLLATIAEVESVRADPVTKGSAPWPWTINVEGVGYFYDTKQDAIDAVKAFQSAGARSIDVGCMQVNLMYHPSAFASLDDAFDPQTNAIYAGRFLRELFQQTGSWPQAAGFYHSQTPARGAEYESNVMARWPSAGRYADVAPSASSAVKLADYSVYTPAFAATLHNMERDLTRVEPTLSGSASPRGRSVPIASRMASLRRSSGYQKPG